MRFRLRALFIIPVFAATLSLSSAPQAAEAAKAETDPQPKKARASRVVASSVMPDFLPPSPESPYTHDHIRMVSSFARPDDPGLKKIPTIDFCSEWNPEFSFNGHRCCRSLASVRTRKSRVSCFSRRPRADYCDEMTEEQRLYQKAIASGKSDDILELITREMGRKDQAYCTANNGFLAHGRPVVPTADNRITLMAAHRCTQFGTDHMVGLLEWLGRQIGKQYTDPGYTGVNLLVGDVSAPRGGCLSGTSGRRGHLSHTNGQDADIGLLTVRKNGRSPSHFHTTFDAKENWWMIKQIFANPYACVKVIFLDKRHIKKLGKIAGRDEEWAKLKRFIRHQKGHRNHIHIRVGDHPGQPGCAPGAKPELEEEYYPDAPEGDDVEDSDGLLVRNRELASEPTSAE